ncbi:ABC transporter ATP-binding protein [Gleimia sp. 6138-11-ORH1]|uniref:ABC transporter ATP-binding protein n=1 Tax=Gleimia sp. 6138-11-ORH1 TaxID=2973937 RepID=UPI002168B2E8|nr:ABC transporter ATP-binding protein [Gleimia sp. 6138-11-ORH1]MCS4484178.1 ABC transporter ATP-binding protein [Gleimia sp. 6138-11-ORH1]
MNTNTNETPAALKVTGITKRFGAVTAVDNVDLEIRQGEIVALLGPNGAGKTTLLDIALGLQLPNQGNARLYGMKPISAIRRSLVGVMQQTGGILEDYRVDTFLKTVAATHLNPLSLDEVLEITNLSKFRKQRIVKLSGGEKQRIRFATALLGNPKLLVLDEPTAGMDAVARREYWELMRQFAETGKTIIFATHYLAEAEAFAQRTVIMKSGKIIVDDVTDQIRRTHEQQVLSITLPETELEKVLSYLKSHFLKQITSVAVERQRLTAVGKDLDSVARYLLSIEGAHGLELTSNSLEDVYTNLVGPQNDGEND